MKPIFPTSLVRNLFPLIYTALSLLFTIQRADAIIDVNLQIQLGNPTGATADPNNHSHYLIQRSIEAIDYSDTNGQPNWASWDLTSSDVGSVGRTEAWSVDASLPASFYKVPINTFGSVNGQSYDRGHMCPSGDRTDTVADNQLTFIMSNIIPQAAQQNEVVWATLEGYCRSLLGAQELLIMCGPSDFGTTTIAAGHVFIPSNTWKVIVCAPLGSGTAFDRITNANPASIRVIAVKIPNTDAAGSQSWTTFITSTRQLQADLGYNFFSALPNNLAWVLRSKVDGQTPAAPVITSFFPTSGPEGTSVAISGATLDTVTNVTFNGTVASYTITATNQIAAIVPVGATSGLITVKGLGGTATSASSFIVGAAVAPNFTVAPAGLITISGIQGGPFSPSNQVYTLNNTNATALSWGVSKNSSWLTLSAANGTLTGGSSTDITASVNAAANSLVGGSYFDTITFSNAATGGAVTRAVNLSVLTSPQLVINPPSDLSSAGAIGGPFSPSSLTYTLNNTGSVTLNWTANATASWLSLSSLGGSLGAGASMVVTASINTNANTLPLGSYTDVIGFTNTTNGAGNSTRTANLAVNAPNPAQLNVTPFTGLAASGAVGGPFNPSLQDFTLSNSGSVTLNWTVNATAAWLSLSSSNGTLAGGSSTVVTASINTNANTLPLGSYTDVIGFTNTTNGAGNTTRPASLAVNPPNPAQLVVSPANELTSTGPIGGPFNPDSETYTLSNTGSVAMNWNATASTNWVSLSATSGTLPGGASTDVTVSFGAAANSLAGGVHSSTVTFTNASNGNGSTTRNVTLSIATTSGLIIISAAPVCVTVPANAANGVTVGAVISGRPYTYQASGCAAYVNGGAWTDPDGHRSTNACSLFNLPSIIGGDPRYPFECAGMTNWSLVGKIAGNCIQLGKAGSFIAPASGTLTVTMNENIGFGHNDNSGSWNACVGLGSDYIASGPVGGPFSPPSQSYTLSNSSASAILWMVDHAANWLSVSPESAILPAGVSTNVVVSMNANANLLAPGGYSDNLSFIDTSVGIVAGVRPVTLTVNEVLGGNFFENVESGTNGWTSTGLWHINGNTTCSNWFSATHSWWYGTNTTCTYNTGNINSGDLISPSFVVLGSGTLTYQSWEQTEGAESGFDKRIVYITTNNASSWEQLLQSTDNSAAWHLVTVNLAAYAGRVARLRFSFNTVDESANDFRGWYVDDIRVAGLGGGFAVSPATALSATGPQGGPFSPSNQVYTLSNNGNGSLSWSASTGNNWLTLSLSSGVLASGATANVTVSLNANANGLSVGAYTDTITISNLTANSAVSRAANVTVLTPAALVVSPSGGFTSSGFTGGPFSPSNQTYNLSNTGSVTMNWSAKKTASWLNLSATNGSLAVGASTNLVVTLSANNLPYGSYVDTIGLTNLTSGLGNTTRQVNLTVNPTPANVIADGATLTTEGCSPGNASADPSENVTFNFGLRNTGELSTANLVATLLGTGGVTVPSASQTYGALVGGGATISKSFSFVATGSCGAAVTAVLQLQDGAANLGTISYTIPLGQFTGVFTQNFDAVSAPVLPAGWSTTATGAQSNWVTSATTADTAPNAVFSPDAGNIGVNELVSPLIPITGPGAQLTFRHKYSLTASNASIGFNGGVLEIKIGGGSYADIIAAGGSFASGGYNTTLSSGFSNPLAGRAAWSGSSGGFTTTVVNLPASAAGQNVQLRWRCAAGTAPPPPSSGTLAYWSFDSLVPTADTIAGNLSVSTFTNANSGSLTYPNGTPTANKAISTTGWSTSSGPPNGTYSYYTFSFAPLTGFQVGLSSFGFLDRASGTGPTNFTVQISQDASFATTNFDTGTQTAHVNSAVVLGTNTFTLSNSGLTGTIYVRIYGYKAGNSVSGTWRLDDVIVKGTVSQTLAGAGWYIDSVSIKDAVCCSNAVPLTAFQAWQVRYFVSTNNPAAAPNMDPDGDGQYNSEEFLTGTDPTNSASFFGIISVVREGNDVRVTWGTSAQKTNALQWGRDMTFTNELVIYTNTVPPATNYLDIGAATNVPSRFYRIRLVP